MWVSSPGHVPSQHLAHPSLLAVGTQWEREEAWMLCKHCSAAANTLGCYRHWFSHKSKAQHHRGCDETSSSIPARPAHSHTQQEVARGVAFASAAK